MKILSSLAVASLICLGACTALGLSGRDDRNTVDASGPGQCLLEDWDAYVGKPRQSLPTVPQGLTFRMLCSDCVATMDYRSNRVTFTYDDKNVITRVACG